MTLEELQALKASLVEQISSQQTVVKTTGDQLDSLNSQVVITENSLTAAEQKLNDLNAQLADTQAKIDAYVPPPDPTPTGKLTLKLLVGISGSSDLPGLPDRTFSNSGGLEAPPRRSKASCPHLDHTWKPRLGTKITRAMVKASASTLLDDDFGGIWHERDVDYRKDINAGVSETKARADLNDKIRMSNEYYAHLVSLRNAGEIKRVWMECVFSSYTVSTAKMQQTAAMFNSDADIFGADIDGGAFPHDYGAATLMANCRKWADTYYHGNLSFPEWGWKDDPAGKRMSVMTTQLANIVSRGKPLRVIFHDNPQFGSTLTAAERTQYAALVKQYNG